MRQPLSLLALLAVGCAPEAEITWLERFGFAWTGFNHRVSYLHFGVDDAGVDAAVIGGASSTYYSPELPEGCDEETCSELPFSDSSEVTIGWGRSTTRLASGVAEASLVVTPAGDELEIEIPLHRKGRGEAAVMLQSFELDTDHELAGGPDCYLPSLGWHPRRIALELGEPRLREDGGAVVVTVSGWFEAGYSFEEYRACQDEVVVEAQVLMTVRVLALVSPGDVDRHTVEHGVHYAFSGNPYDPGEQPDPDLAERPLALPWEQAIAGWSALDFRFHEDDADLRGAYIRSLSVGLDLDDGWASGHATNYSPLTQLSDFSYRFTGEVTALEADGATSNGQVHFEDLGAELSEDNRPEIHHQDW
jgi:hypothetical protein